MRDAKIERVDAYADHVRALWQAHPEPCALAEVITADVELWGADLSVIPGLSDSLCDALQQMTSEGVSAALDAHLSAQGAAV